MSSRLIHCLLTSVAIIALLFTAPVTHAGSVTYTYDELNRLIRAEYEDETVIQYTYDGAGNRTALYVNITPPITAASPPGGVYNSTQSVTLTCTDLSGSGCDRTYYTTDGNNPTTSSPVYSSPINISVATTLKFFSTDLAGHSGSVKTQTYTIVDTAPPTTTASPTGGTYNSAQSVTLTCTDGSGFGCDKTYYTTDGSTPTTLSPVYSSSFDISVTTTLKFFSTDLASNSETVKTEVYTVDTTPPTGTITINSGAASTNSLNVTLTVTCDDANGCSQMEFSNDNVNYSSPETYAATKAWTLSEGSGTKTVYAKVKDVAGNWSTAYSDTIEYSDAWLSGWSYRKSVTLSRPSGAVSNYQMKLLVGETSGATGENVDCGGHIQSDFDDLRFTNLNGDLLNYWIESITGTTPNQLATVWIKFDSIGTGATTFYMYYGKEDAAAASNGANTFIVFDGFERGADGDTIGGSWTETTAHVHISTDHNYTRGGTRCAKWVGEAGVPAATIPVTASENQAVRFRFWKENAAQSQQFHGGASKRMYALMSIDDDLDYYDGAWHDGPAIMKDAWSSIEYNGFDFTTGKFSAYENNEVRLNNVNMQSAGWDGIFYIDNVCSGVGNDLYIDDFIVRHWRSTEPAWGSWGNEEAGW